MTRILKARTGLLVGLVALRPILPNFSVLPVCNRQRLEVRSGTF